MNSMTEEMDELIYYLHLELESNSCLVPCEDGSGTFVSTGAVNGFTSRLKRALRDESYRHNLLNKFKEGYSD